MKHNNWGLNTSYSFQDVIEALGEVPSNPYNAVPRKRVRIVDCGLNDFDRKYDLTEEQLDSTEDL